MFMYKMKYKIAVILIIAFALTSCIVVKKDSDYGDYRTISLSPKPQIEMSENVVRSYNGDMIAFLPKDWFFIDIEEDVSSEIFAVAVNPEYTLSLIFIVRKRAQPTVDVVEDEGLFGLSRLALEMHQKKTGGSVASVGRPTLIKMGNKEFVEFEFSNSGGALSTKAAVFISSIGNYYEIALTPMTFRGKPLPTSKEMDMIFRSVLATVQF